MSKILRVSRTELEMVEKNLLSQMEALEKKLATTTQQLWENQRELKEGLDVAEFHLRAYRRLIADLCNKTFGDGDVQTIMVPTGAKDDKGEPVTTRVVNMRHYFESARDEIKMVQEKDRLQALHNDIAKAVKKLYETCTAESLEDIATRVEQGEKILKDDQLKELELDDQMRAVAVTMLRKAVGLKNAPPTSLTQVEPNDGIPEGAAVFGGDHAASSAGNEGQEEPDPGGEDGAPSDVPQGEVPTVQARDGVGGPEQGQQVDV